MEEGARLLADELERLMRLPLTNESELERWYSEAEKVKHTLRQAGYVDFPHHIWHYFSDADIRAREPGYKKKQEQAISDYIAQVRS
jgi:hypothetical protein